MTRPRVVVCTVFLVTALLPDKGLSSSAVEEFYAALYNEVAVENDGEDTLPQNAIGRWSINLKRIHWRINGWRSVS